MLKKIYLIRKMGFSTMLLLTIVPCTIRIPQINNSLKYFTILKIQI